MDNPIARSAARLRWAVLAASVLVALLYLSARLGLQLAGTDIEIRSHSTEVFGWRVIADVTMVLLLVALFRLAQTLGAIAAGELFSIPMTRRFRSFAFWLMLLALFGFFAPLVAEAIGRHGEGPMLFALDLRQLVLLGITLFLFLLARLMERARELEAEMREFV